MSWRAWSRSRNRRLIEKLVAHPTVEAFDEAVLHRLAGRDVVPVDLMSVAQPRMAFEVNSVPWSLTIIPRLAAPLDERRQLAGDPPARDRRVGDRRQAFAGHVIDDVEDAEAPARGELVVDEVERPACVDPGLDQDRRPRSHRPAPGSALAHRQSFLAVEAIDAVDARRLALPPQQDEQPSVAETATLIGEITQSGAQFGLGRSP